MTSPNRPETFRVVPRTWHDDVMVAVWRHRGYSDDEARAAAVVASEASWHGIRTHNGIKALHIEEKHRRGGGAAVPGAAVERLPSRFPASQVWDAHRKLGPPVALAAMDACMELADKYGVGQVSVDNACHYLWGGGYVLRAARRGYIAYTNCTAGLSEVVPFGGRAPTIGTNPHSWAFPTQEIVGFCVLVDWATSLIAMGRIDQCRREGLALPPGAAVDKNGEPTTDPAAAAALLPFGAHKGYGLGLVNELMAGYIGGSLPTQRNRAATAGEKHTPSFYFQAVHPDAISSGRFAGGRSQSENVRAVLADVLGHGNNAAHLPGQIEADAAARSAANKGLLFSEAEITALNQLAAEAGRPPLRPAELPVAS